MIPELRKEQILKLLNQNEVMFMKDISKSLNISLSTTRRDLQELSQTFPVEVMRGGAVRIKKYEGDDPISQKQFLNTAQKVIIAKRACALIEEGDSIYIDAGTTATTMLDYMEDKYLTVVTSSISILDKLNCKKINYILLGGEIRKDQASVQGTLTEKMISNMYFDKVFLGANGFVEGEGIYTYNAKEASKKELLINHSKKAYVLVDSSKRNKRSFMKIENFYLCTILTEE
ncbi:DeoR/GlpR family DNA-binding transcription regulator [Candidatus Epulonipiscium viviparus]|uniref:DeoR/GlpR family DNA-binding transcription regulator n=1 Tax=Candidatus Epulonipiscium viviparus TaxID=420336 RepID=UPI00016C0A19|nr:DeoR/GlpR family DNA-binding transcription regulator [Candidatus Epulopiscium viviparus]